jgi:hypothetical protein
MGVNEGIRAENFFMARLNKVGIPYEYVDEWYDLYLPQVKEKVEIKSCLLSIKNNDKKHPHQFRIGRFDFTKKENRKKQFKENIWIAFIIRYFDDFLICGMCRAKKIDKKRYITVHNLRELGLVSFKDWVEKYQEKKNVLS